MISASEASEVSAVAGSNASDEEAHFMTRATGRESGNEHADGRIETGASSHDRFGNGSVPRPAVRYACRVGHLLSSETPSLPTPAHASGSSIGTAEQHSEPPPGSQEVSAANRQVIRWTIDVDAGDRVRAQ